MEAYRAESDYKEAFDKASRAVEILQADIEEGKAEDPKGHPIHKPSPETAANILELLSDIEDSLWLPSDYERNPSAIDSFYPDGRDSRSTTHGDAAKVLCEVAYELETREPSDITVSNDGPSGGMITRLKYIRKKVDALR